LILLGKKHFAALEDYPEASAFWWPRFQRIARWFADWERVRRVSVKILQAEISGKIEIPVGDRTFRLSARADRIEIRDDGRVAIVDYKTGQAPTEKQVRLGLSPQLTLEAAILREGGFQDVPRSSVGELLYVRLRGGEPAGEPCPIDFETGTPDSHAARALAKLKEIVAHFDNEATPYRSLVHPMWKNHYGVYDHLARVKEWSATGGEEDDTE
jgi:ATP-dependent helicase/nuclease subunit B